MAKTKVLTLGALLRQSRREARKKLEDVGADTGLAISTISEYENDLHRPPPGRLLALCVATSAPVERAFNLARRGCSSCSTYDDVLAEYMTEAKAS